MPKVIRPTLFRQKGSSFWQARFAVYDAALGKWQAVKKSTKTENRDEARAILTEWARLAKIAGGGIPGAAMTRDYALEVVNHVLRLSGHPMVIDSRPWDEYAGAWLANQKRAVKASSARSYTTHIDTFNAFLGARRSIPLNRIDSVLLGQHYQRLIAEGRSVSTANNHLKVLGIILQRAVQEGLIRTNPAHLVTRSRDTVRREREVFTPADIRAILGYLTTVDHAAEWRTLVLLGLCTAQRIDDCAKIMWSQIDLDGVPHPIWTLTTGKTGKRLKIPLVDPLKSDLGGRSSAHLYVLPNLSTWPIGGEKGLSTTFAQHVIAAGVAGTIVPAQGKKGHAFNTKTFHSFRHTTNSLMANAGIADALRRKIVGHDSARVSDGYTHVEAATAGQALVDALKEVV